MVATGRAVATPGSPPGGGSCRGAPASIADRGQPGLRPPVPAGASSPARLPVPRSRRPRLRPTPGAGCGSVRPGSFCGRRMRGRPGNLPSADEVHQTGPQGWPREGSLPDRLGGQDRRRRFRVLVVVRVSSSSAAAWACQAAFPARSPRSVRRRSARQPARPAGSSQGPPGLPDSPAAGSAAADGVEVEVAGSAAADVGGSTEVGGWVVVGGSTEVGGWVVVGGSTEVGGRVVAGGSVVVQVGRVVGVAVSLGASVTLGAGRVPERSVEVRVDETLPSPVPQPPSSRTSPITSPAGTRALAAPRPVTEGPALGFLLAGTIGRRGPSSTSASAHHLRTNRAAGDHVPA